MPIVKINHLTNLQDARYCAAFPIEYVSFCMERGHMRKLAEETVLEIKEWLSGPHTVLQFGQDHEGLLDWHSRFPQDGLLLEATLTHPTQPLPNVPAERLVLHLSLSADDAFTPADVQALAARCHVLEVQPSTFAQPMQEKLQTIVANTFNVVLNVDATGSELLERLPQKPYGIALREAVSEDEFNLDYDKTEAIISRFRGFYA